MTAISRRNREDIKPQKHKAKYTLTRRHSGRRREIDKKDAISISDLLIDTLDEVNLIGRSVREQGDRLDGFDERLTTLEAEKERQRGKTPQNP